MFTTIDKAIAALIGGVLSVLVLMGLDVPDQMRTPEAIAGITGLVSGILTWAVPNRTRRR